MKIRCTDKYCDVMGKDCDYATRDSLSGYWNCEKYKHRLAISDEVVPDGEISRLKRLNKCKKENGK